MDKMDSQLFDLVRGEVTVALTCDLDAPGIRLMDAGQNLDQSGFTRAVLPDKAMDGPSTDTKVRAVKCAGPSEPLDDIAHRERRLFPVCTHSNNLNR